MPGRSSRRLTPQSLVFDVTLYSRQSNRLPSFVVSKNTPRNWNVLSVLLKRLGFCKNSMNANKIINKSDMLRENDFKQDITENNQ